MTNPKVDIRALAQLARLEITDEEVTKLEKELPGILAFVEQVQQASTTVPTSEPVIKNVMRADENPHESGIHTEKLLGAAPAREGDQLKVMQVLRQK